jgi:DNA topoisomerase-1
MKDNFFTQLKGKFLQKIGRNLSKNEESAIQLNFFENRIKQLENDLLTKGEDLQQLHTIYDSIIGDFDNQYENCLDLSRRELIKGRKERYDAKHLIDVQEVTQEKIQLEQELREYKEAHLLLKGEESEDGLSLEEFNHIAVLIVKGHELGYINDEQLEKAKLNIGKLSQQEVTVHRGGKTFQEKRWIDPNKNQGKENDRKKHTPEDIDKFLRNTSTEQLQTISTSEHNEAKRLAAKKELKRRETEEDGIDDKKDKGEKKEPKAKKERKEQFWDKYNFPALNAYPIGIDETKVTINNSGDINSHAVMSWKHPESGKLVHAYTREFLQRNAENKWKRISNINKSKVDAIKTSALSLLNSKDEKEKEAGAIIAIMINSGLRPGDKEQFKKTGNRGISTLQGENINIKGGKISLAFKGKSYVDNVSDFEEPTLAKYLTEKKKTHGKNDFLFDIGKEDLKKIFREKMGAKGLKLKDTRTYVATALAGEMLHGDKTPPPPLEDNISKTELKKVIQTKLKGVFEAVSQKLNNTPAMAKSSYIHPQVIHDWLTKLSPLAVELYKGEDADSVEVDDKFDMDSLLKKYKYPNSQYLNNLDPEDEDECDEYPLPGWWDESQDEESEEEE